MRVHFVGEPDNQVSISSQHGRALAATGVQVTFDTADTPWRSLCRECDVVHLVSYESLDYSILRRMRSARAAGVVVFRYWTGLDVLWAKCHAPTQLVAKALADLGVVQLAANEALLEDLSRIGIEASIQPPVCLRLSTANQPQALPDDFTVLCHLPTPRRELYGGDRVDQLIASLPGVRFLILGDTDTDYGKHENVESLGVVDDVRRSIHRATAVLDVRRFQGTSRLILEGMSLGRHAITTVPVEHARLATTLPDLERSIRALRTTVEFNLDGREYVGETFDRGDTVLALRQRMEQALEPGRASLTLKGKLRATSQILKTPGVLSRRRFDLPDPNVIDQTDEATQLLVKQAHDALAVAATTG